METRIKENAEVPRDSGLMDIQRPNNVVHLLLAAAQGLDNAARNHWLEDAAATALLVVVGPHAADLACSTQLHDFCCLGTANVVGVEDHDRFHSPEHKH